MQTWKKTMNVVTYQQVLTYVVDGMKGLMNDKHLEVRVMGQQTNVENVVPLVASGIVEKKCNIVKMLGKHLMEMMIKL
jgi:hypothetical protein